MPRLILIYIVQTCVPAILPPLKDLYPGDLAHDLSGTTFDIVIIFGGKDRVLSQVHICMHIFILKNHVQLNSVFPLGGVILFNY